MPWKLISVLLTMTLFVVFAGLNLDNSCDITIGLYTWPNVPVFITMFAAFGLGVLAMVPALIRMRGQVHKEKKAKGLLEKARTVAAEEDLPRTKPKKNRLFGKKDKNNSPGESTPE